jgi:glycerophosphoryl diester phosphodiesterase
MSQPHPALPDDRPLVIAHRYGNDTASAKEAWEAGADMIETDVWRFRNRLEIRHLKTMGPLPLLWDRWELHPGWKQRYLLEHLMHDLPPDARLFLDLKGKDTTLPHRILDLIAAEQPDRQIIVCGRTWAQLDEIEGKHGVHTFYSVGSDTELLNIWSRLNRMAHPAVSIAKRYLLPDIVERFRARGVTMVTWTVNTFAEAKRLHELGVDGFTTDNPEMIRWIPRERAAALDRPDPAPVRA